jgi:uncharacterized membrane protein
MSMMTTRPSRPGPRARKSVLLVHIAAAGIWLGLDVAMAVLVFTAMGTDDPSTQASALQSLSLVTVWPMFIAGVVSLATGVLLGLGTRYGLVRYWWVLVKLVLNVVLCLLVLFALRGGVREAADAGRAIGAGVGTWTTGDLIYPPIVSPTALTIAFVLSVFKPWGRVRPRPGPDGQVRVTAGPARPTSRRTSRG